MKNFFEDEFINKKVFSHLIREIKRDQLEATISELEYFSELQDHFLNERALALKTNAR